MKQIITIEDGAVTLETTGEDGKPVITPMESLEDAVAAVSGEGEEMEEEGNESPSPMMEVAEQNRKRPAMGRMEQAKKYFDGETA